MTQDMNYFLGLRASDGVLVADLKRGRAGGSPPVTNLPSAGVTRVRQCMESSAATYDGTTWRLYLNGQLDGNYRRWPATPRSDSIQHASLASALTTSTGAAAEFFAGILDEARNLGTTRGRRHRSPMAKNRRLLQRQVSSSGGD